MNPESEGNEVVTIEKVIAELNKQCDCREIPYGDLKNLAKKLDLQFACGETRYCLIHRSWDKVIKIPRLGYASKDYSEIECNNYTKAKALGIEKIFLPCEYWCTLDCGCPVYVQDKFTTDHRSMYDAERKVNMDKVSKIISCKIYFKVKRALPSDRIYDDAWLARAYQIYGKQFFRKLEKFLRENRINDLHAKNVGWKGTQPIILDFAGYDE